MSRALSKFNMYTGEVEFIEVITSDRSQPPKVEQMQSVVRQQDAALSSDESGGSAAGNPDGLLMELEIVIKTYRRKLINRHRGVGAHSQDASLEDSIFVMDKLLQMIDGQGAA
jgi:alpha-acetolactate decarboxylase